MARLITILWLAMLALLPGIAPASAHKLKVFATAIGAKVEGRAYFVGGGAAIGVPIILTNSAGEVVAATNTQAPGGIFTLTAPYRDDFDIGADAQDGHVALMSLSANRFPQSLPAAPNAVAATQTEPVTSNRPAALAASSASADLDAIEAAVARQIAPLTDQIDELRASVGLRDMIGGIGYVLGIFGILALFARRRGRPQ